MPGGWLYWVSSKWFGFPPWAGHLLVVACCFGFALSEKERKKKKMFVYRDSASALGHAFTGYWIASRH
jgi:hypothetical protein